MHARTLHAARLLWTGALLAVVAATPVAARGQTATPARQAHSLAADSLRILIQRSRYDEAERFGRAEIDRLQGGRNTDSLAVAAILDRLAEAVWRRGGRLPADAEAMAARAVRIREQGLGSGHPDVAAALTSLGRIQRTLRKHAEARASYERALAIRRAALPPDDPDLAVSLTSLGLIQRDLAQYEESLALLEEALLVRERRLGPDHRDVAAALSNLSQTWINLGQFGRASALLSRAVRILEAASPLDTTTLVRVMTNHASALMYIQDWEGARAIGRRSLQILDGRVPDSHRALAEARENLAVCEMELGAHDTARALFELALPAVRAADPNGLLEARLLGNYAKLEWRTGHFDSSAARFRRTAELYEGKAGTERARSVLWANWAQMLMHRGEVGQAIQMNLRTVALRESLQVEGHPDLVMARFDAALGRWMLGDTTRVFRDVLGTLQDIYRIHEAAASGLTEREALAYIEAHRGFSSFALALAEQLPAPERVLPVWEVIQGERGMVLDEMAWRRRLPTLLADSAAASLVAARERACRDVATLLFTGPRGAEPQIAAAAAARDRIDQDIAALGAGLDRQRLHRGETLESILRHLAPGDAMVAYVTYQRRSFAHAQAVLREARRAGTDAMLALDRADPMAYGAFVALGGQAQARFVPLAAAGEVDSLVERWRHAAADPRAKADARRAGTRLRRLAWDPIQAAMGKAERVFVVPEGTLHLVQFAALPSGARSYLVETGPTFHTLSTERDLLAQAEREPVGGLLAVGGVDFDAKVPATAAVARPRSNYRGAATACIGLEAKGFGSLPFSRTEAEVVAAVWNRSAGALGKAALWSGDQANETAFKARAGSFGAIHLATHGFFLSEDCPTSSIEGVRESPLVRSGLVLAGANRRSMAGADEDDGLLTAEEVATLDLSSTRLVVLSACNTAQGSIRSGEGVFGLRRALLIAGERSQIMSLWEVNDVAARRWMEVFYQARIRDGKPVPDAVRHAARTVLAEQRARGGDPGPAAWGGFVASGDWR